jgi:hypothetical protein
VATSNPMTSIVNRLTRLELTHGPSTASSLHSNSRKTVALGRRTPASVCTALVSSPNGTPGISFHSRRPISQGGHRGGHRGLCNRKYWSERRDLNSGPLAPHASALPGCATLRHDCSSWGPERARLGKGCAQMRMIRPLAAGALAGFSAAESASALRARRASA